MLHDHAEKKRRHSKTAPIFSPTPTKDAGVERPSRRTSISTSTSPAAAS